MMTIREALQWARQELSDSPTAAGDARLLLQHTLQVGRSHLVAHGEEALPAGRERAFRRLVTRARGSEPIPYITGEAPFYGLDFEVTTAVLIPRPETELLVQAAIEWGEAHGATTVADVGTGSGCIAVTLARHLPDARIAATEISPEALAVAQRNAERHGVAERIDFRRGSLLEPVDGDLDLIVANLPYVSDAEWTTLADGVKWYEPAGALRGGADGLALIRQLLEQARSRCQAGGALFLEIGWRQGKKAVTLARTIFPQARVDVLPDHAGHDRILVIESG